MRGQSSVEFLVYISIAILIFTYVMWSTSSLQDQLNSIKTNVEAERLCNKIAFEVNSAVRSGDGYGRKFYVEKNIFGISDFQISVGNYSVFIDWNKGSVSSSVIIKNINGVVDTGFNNIENINGEIYVTQS